MEIADLELSFVIPCSDDCIQLVYAVPVAWEGAVIQIFSMSSTIPDIETIRFSMEGVDIKLAEYREVDAQHPATLFNDIISLVSPCLVDCRCPRRCDMLCLTVRSVPENTQWTVQWARHEDTAPSKIFVNSVSYGYTGITRFCAPTCDITFVELVEDIDCTDMQGLVQFYTRDADHVDSPYEVHNIRTLKFCKNDIEDAYMFRVAMSIRRIVYIFI